jgi:peptidoglycan glycosyltransferase
VTDSFLSKRIRWLGLFILLCFVAVFVQLNNLQVVQAHKYATASGNPAVIAARYNETRGTITSSDGTVLANSQKAPRGSTYAYQRQYPTGALFGQITGTFSYIYGLYGVEASYNRYLTAHNKPVKSLSDLLTTSKETDTVILTVSNTLQNDAKNALGNNDGSVVVIKPDTGAILAMYSNPSYDPTPLSAQQTSTEESAFKSDNAGDSLGHAPFTSLAYQDIAFPGSTFKVVTTAATYERAPQLVDVPIPGYSCIPPGTLRGQTTPLCNFGGGYCGGTIAVMLPPSCDTGFALLGTKVGADNMVAEANSFGFNQQPPLDLPPSPNQVSQFLQPRCYENAQIFLAFSSIGQDCTKATPLQMALVAAGIANGGTIMVPHLMFQVRDAQGQLVTAYKPKVWQTATSRQTASAITGLMQNVARFGTAAGIFPASEDVAAKTGTAQVESTTGQFVATNDWMIAFAPASAPKVAVAVELLHQPVSSTGAANAGPVMATIIQDALAQLGG